MPKEIRNLTVLTSINDLYDEIGFSTFEQKTYFTHICNFIPDKINEKLTIEYLDIRLCNVKGLVYILVINDKILAIGETTDNIKGRVSSYNSGKNKYRKQTGTNSTTNYFILQSILNINLTVFVYAYIPDKSIHKIFNTTVESSFSATKEAKKLLLSKIDNIYNKLPIGCSQH